MISGSVARRAAAAMVVVYASAACIAQQNPPASPPGGQQGSMRPYDRGFSMRDETARILPPGPWWKDADLVQRLELTPDQQKRIDDTFQRNRVTLVHIHTELDQEQLVLEPMLNSNPVDQSKVMTEISKIADMRAELFKATARTLLQVRGVLTQAQWARLQQERPNGMRRHMYPHGSFGSQGRPDVPSPPSQP